MKSPSLDLFLPKIARKIFHSEIEAYQIQNWTELTSHKQETRRKNVKRLSFADKYHKNRHGLQVIDGIKE